ncbi:MAG TPA: pyruvate, phosphate dikinase, partial [Euryarchaeota archaeon]|nr:pyruvate, phosphate dikinase [Euryarchaeota archaeon]
SQGEGKLGGKSSGIYLAQKIIEKESEKQKELKNIKFTKSWYITSDTMMNVIRYNDMDDIVYIKYQEPGEIKQEHSFLEQILKNCTFPPDIVSGLHKILREVGDKPIIVRSSSLLEDSFGASFSGKYKSLFLVNTGTEEEKVSALINAISEVYASTFALDPIEYRKEKGLLDFSEEMGILIQGVVGTRIGPYYLPAYAGVALSNNEFRWSPRIRREDGIIRLVAGLGTRAVDRMGNDYPVLVAPNRPEIHVNTLIDETIQYSQHYMDVINLEKGTMETIKATELMRQYWDDYPQVNKIVSAHKEGTLSPVQGIILDIENADLVVTFNELIEKSDFIPQMKAILNTLKLNLGTPVDIEFAHDGRDLYLLQCRPQYQTIEQDRIPVPKNIPPNRKIFTANKYVTTSHIDNIEYIVYVDPNGYENLQERDQMLGVARAIGCLNKKLPKRKFILMGPGRWGSRGDIKLGVPVQYNDINKTSLLIEIARKKGAYLPDLSFGTHFFQDLVEANIHYLPLYPDETENVFNEKLLDTAPNKLSEYAPRYSEFKNVIKVIKISEIADGGTLSIIMDGEANTALAYLVPPDHWEWRKNKAEEIARTIDQELYGIKAIYIIGSTKNGTAGPASDLDLVIHVEATEEQKEQLMLWLKGQDLKLVEENKERTGIETETILDIHLVTDEDIEKNTSWASHINSPYDPAKKLDIPPREN